GSSWAFSSNPISLGAAFSSGGDLGFVDLNGDGLPDSTGGYAAYLNSGGAFKGYLFPQAPVAAGTWGWTSASSTMAMPVAIHPFPDFLSQNRFTAHRNYG